MTMFDGKLFAIIEAYDKVRVENGGVSVKESQHGYVAVDREGHTIGFLDFHVCHGDEAIDELSDTVGYDSVFRTIEPLQKCVYVEELFVERPYRHMGIAKRLIEKLIEYHGHDQIVLRAFDDRGESAPSELAVMYEKFGFHRVLDTETDGIVMIRKPSLDEGCEDFECHAYDPPMTADEVKRRYGEKAFKRLFDDPIHRWRMETGIELIHREPTEREFRRILGNWKSMSDKQKAQSDRKSIELFGMDNLNHAKVLKKEYRSNRLFRGIERRGDTG